MQDKKNEKQENVMKLKEKYSKYSQPSTNNDNVKSLSIPKLKQKSESDK